MSDTTPDLALELAKKALEIAKANPDYVYEPPIDPDRCLYIYAGLGSCLYGQAWIAAGLDVAALREGVGISSNLAGLVDEPFERFMELDRGQFAQDQGDPWSSAIPHLETFIRERS